MSVFDQAQQPEGQSQAAEQQAVTTEQQESFLAKLVAVKGDNWKDPEVLAKGKLEADGYIKTLEDQLTAMREDLGKQEYSKQLLDQLQNKATAPTNVNTVAPTNNNKDNGSTNTDGNTQPQVSEESLKSLVEQTLTKRDQDNTVKQNLAIVDGELEKSYGTEAVSVIQKKASELGMTVQRMQDIAAESPTAFFALLGEQKKSFSPMVQGSVRTEGVNMQASTERDWNYYQNLRRENKSAYYSPKVQQQLMNDRQRLGSKFGL
jgi:hypothetical protein